MSLPLNAVLLGDCLEILPTLPASSIDCVVCDPPYGLGNREPTLDEILAYLQGSGLNTGGDFMGHAWQIPSVAVWRECFRVLKPGGHLLSFAGTRTIGLIHVGIQAAGFQCRDTVATQFGTTVLQWVYGSGFPKSLNIAKALTKAGAAPEVVARWQGWGTALKPSWEPVLVFRKPLEGSTVAAQVLATGTGGLNIDALRITTQESLNGGAYAKAGSDRHDGAENWRYKRLGGAGEFQQPSGRWPANVLLVHQDGCKQVGTQRVKAPVINRFDDGMKPFGDGAGHAFTSTQTGDADGMEEVPVYECEDGCPVKLLDQQSGVLKSGTFDQASKKAENTIYGKHHAYSEPKQYEVSVGGASRFFGQIQPDAPFLYTAKVSKSERNKGFNATTFQEGFVMLREDLAEEDREKISSEWPHKADPEWPIRKDLVPAELLGFFDDMKPGVNPHPTLKPLALMTWLVKLVTPRGGVVLDPYCGSGTTCIAALDSDCKYIGIERDPTFHDVALKRVEGMKPELEINAERRSQQSLLSSMEDMEQE